MKQLYRQKQSDEQITECIIEARNADHEWDSDYVGNQSMTFDQALETVQDMKVNSDWDGWQFRIIGCDVDGCYCVVMG